MRDQVSDEKIPQGKWGEAMIIEYDDRPNLTPEQKIQSLKENIQLALNEIGNNSENLYRSLLKALGVETASLRNDFTSLQERLEAEAQALTEAVSNALERLETIEQIAEQVEPILTRLATLETNYTALAGRVSTLETNYTALEIRVKALEDA